MRLVYEAFLADDGGEYIVNQRYIIGSECLLQVVCLYGVPIGWYMPFQMSGYLPSSILPSVVWHGLAWLGGGTFSRVRATVILRYFFEVFFKPAILCFYVVVYGDLHYLDAVHKEAECSMLSSVAEVQALPNYAQQGEVHL